MFAEVLRTGMPHPALLQSSCCRSELSFRAIVPTNESVDNCNQKTEVMRNLFGMDIRRRSYLPQLIITLLRRVHTVIVVYTLHAKKQLSLYKAYISKIHVVSCLQMTVLGVKL